MKKEFKTNSEHSTLIVLILTAVLFQLLGRYYSSLLLWRDYVDICKILTLFLLPLLTGRFYLKMKWSEMGLARPQWKKVGAKPFLNFVFLVTALIGFIQIFPHYLDYYNLTWRRSEVTWNDFLLFTIPTMIGWEFLNRGFLLFGIKKYLERLRVDQELAGVIAILWVLSLEVFYHFIKPDLEAWGMLFLSPILSVVALRTRSIFIPFLVHLWIECLFFSFLR